MTDTQALIIASGLLGSESLGIAYAFWARQANIKLQESQVTEGDKAIREQTKAVLELAQRQKERNQIDADYVAAQRAKP